VTYLNGVVGASGPNNPTPNVTSATGGVRAGRPSRAGTISFTGAAFSSGLEASDTELSVGPYVKLAYDAFDLEGGTLHFSPFLQYTFTTAFDSANSAGTETLSTVTYQAAPPANTVMFAGPPPAIPTQTFQRPFGVRGPASGINIYMHTFTLGFDMTKDLTDRVHLVLSTGPCLNYFNTGLTSAAPVAGISRSSNDTVCWGWIGQVGVTVDLDSKKRWYIEASGNYHYAEPFSVSDTITSAKVNASSWVPSWIGNAFLKRGPNERFKIQGGEHKCSSSFFCFGGPACRDGQIPQFPRKIFVEFSEAIRASRYFLGGIARSF